MKMDNKGTDGILTWMRTGNQRFMETADKALLADLTENGQHPFAIVVCCSDSRVMPEAIFDASLGELFVIRVAGNVLDHHQLGSIEYAVEHLHCSHIIVLGHTGCGAVSAALNGCDERYIRYITEDIQKAIGEEKDPYKACCLNVEHAVTRLKGDFRLHPEIGGVIIKGAVYDIRSGEVKWLC